MDPKGLLKLEEDSYFDGLNKKLLVIKSASFQSLHSILGSNQNASSEMAEELSGDFHRLKKYKP